MELRDLIVTPFFIVIAYAGAYLVRPYVCDTVNYRYFFPALTLKIMGALAVGFLYQFYYDGGDTFNYHTHGSRVIWNTFIEDPTDGLELIFFPVGWHDAGLHYLGISKIAFYTDPPSYFVVRVLGFVDLFTFSTYSASAVVFASLSFAGAWMMFIAFYRVYPRLVNWIAIAMFFIPSVFFWGSGILKDTLVMAALGATVLLIQSVFIERRSGRFISFLVLCLCLIVIYMTKKYVLLCFVPAAILWIYLKYLYTIRSLALRVLVVPLVLGMFAVSSYYSVFKIGEGDSKYSIDKLAVTAKITADDIGFYTGRDAGSRYSIGVVDGTFGGMLRLAPQAINVSLFRPYLWEVKNPLMLMAAAESLALLVATLVIFFRSPIRFFRAMGQPYILFCFVFAIAFAFAVGVSTFNFGTLARYKIPMLPFYTIGLVLIYDYLRIDRNRAVLEVTE